MKLHTMGEFLSPVDGLLELSAEISAPAFISVSSSATVMGKTLQDLEKFKSIPSAPESIVEQVMQKAQEENISILEAAFSGKGIVMNNKG